MYARDIARIATPVGIIAVEGDALAVHRVQIDVSGAVTNGTTAPVRCAADQLEQWFAGERMVFDLR